MADNARELADLAVETAEKAHEFRCKTMDDHQTHIQRALEQSLPAKLASKMADAATRYMDRMVDAQLSWNETHHRKGVESTTPATGTDGSADEGESKSTTEEETPSPRGRPSTARRVLTHPLTVAAATCAAVLGATKLLTPTPEPDTGSVFQSLEDRGFHLPRANEPN